MNSDPICDAVVSDLRQLLAERLPACELVALLEVGSTAEGLATTTSDVDLMAVLRGDLDRRQWQYICVNMDGRELEIQLVPFADLKKTAAQRGADFTVNTSIREVELQYRLMFGKPLLVAPCVEAVLHTFDRAAFVWHAIVRYQEGSMDYIEDLHGCLQACKPWTAAEIAREFARSMVDAYLLSRGDGYPKPKWRIERTLRTVPAAAAPRFLALEFGRARANEVAAPNAILNEALQLAMLAARATFFPTDDVARIVRAAQSWRGRFRLAPCVTLLRPRGGWLALTPSDSYELDDPAALCLSALAGELLFEERSVPRQLAFQPKIAVGESEAAQIFCRLDTVGLIEPMPARG